MAGVPAPTAKHVLICSGCAKSICEGDFYYDLGGEQYCEKCVVGSRQVAKHEDS